MKTLNFLITQAAAFAVMLSTQAQGTFQNLNFESANVGSLTFAFSVPVSSALPAWTVNIGSIQQTGIGYNAPSTGAPAVWLIGPGYGPTGFAPIDGNYSVILQGSFTASAPSISQTGLIPDGTQSLLFEAQAGSGALNILVGTQIVPFADVGNGPNYTLYGINISEWAGQTEQLTFSALQGYTGMNDWTIDDISFSTTAIAPEPNIVALTAIGGLLFGARKWFTQR